MALTLCFAIPFLLAAIPGKFLSVEPEYVGSSRADKHIVALHGWPAVHCIANHESHSTTESEALNNRRISDSVLFGEEGRLFAENVNSVIWANEHKTNFKFVPLDFEFNGPSCYSPYQHQNFWSNISHYGYFGPGIWPRWSPIGLLINTVCFFFYLAAITISFEFLRRRKKHFFQITILDFLIGIGILAIVVGWFTNHYQRSNSIRKSIDIAKTSSSFSSHFHLHNFLPIWLERLTDGRFDELVRKNWAEASGSNMPPSRLPLGCTNFRTRIYDIVDSKPVIHFVKQAKTISAIGLSAEKTETLYEVIESLNPNYLQEIEIYHKKEFDVSRLANKHSLRQMELHSIELQMSDLKEPGFEQVEWLRFWGTDPNGLILKLINSMPQLNTLYCKKEILDSIEILPDQLRTLGVTFDADFELIDSREKFSNLTRLGLYPAHTTKTKKYQLPREIGINLEKLPNLRRLVFGRISLDDTTIDRLNTMPNLEVVVLYDYQSDMPADVLKKLIPEIAIVQ